MTSSAGRRRAKGGDPHGWNSLQNYLKVHERRLDDLRGHYVLDDTLEKTFPAPDVMEIRGRIGCKHGLFVDVRKTLEINDRDQVRTVTYRYHAGIEGSDDRAIFRYDNVHSHAGHEDEHHKHRFCPRTWQEIVPPEWVGYDGWPHLNQVIEELRVWWETTGRHLGLADTSETEQASDAGSL
jgi:hypothetical protein